MASYQVIQEQPGFGTQLLGEVLKTWLGKKMDAGFSASKKTKDTADIKSALGEWQNKPDYETSVKYGSDGMTFEASPKKKPSIDSAYSHLMKGISSPEETAMLGQATGVQRPAEVPGMSMADGSVGNIPAEGQIGEEGFKQALQKTLFPGYSQEQIRADAATLPTAKTGSAGVSDEFKNDFKSAIENSNDNDKVLQQNLHMLSKKYAGDSVAMKHIRELLSINNPEDSEANAFNF